MLLYVEVNGWDMFKLVVVLMEEYDYVEFCLMVWNKGLSIGCFFILIKVFVMIEENDFYYYVFEIEDDVFILGSFSIDVYRIF